MGRRVPGDLMRVLDPQQVLGEGAEEHTRGRVCSPFARGCPRIDSTYPDAWQYSA